MPNPAPFEIPPEMLAFAERSFEQAKFAFDKFMDAAQSTMNTFEKSDQRCPGRRKGSDRKNKGVC